MRVCVLGEKTRTKQGHSPRRKKLLKATTTASTWSAVVAVGSNKKNKQRGEREKVVSGQRCVCVYMHIYAYEFMYIHKQNVY